MHILSDDSSYISAILGMSAMKKTAMKLMKVVDVLPSLEEFHNTFLSLVQNSIVSEYLIKRVESDMELCYRLLSEEVLDVDIALCQERIQAILDFTWEKLNTGYWKNIDITWRYLYSFASVLKSILLFHEQSFSNAVHASDMGALMGAPICDNLLQELASAYSGYTKSDVSEPVPKKLKLTDEAEHHVILNDKYKLTYLIRPSLMEFHKFLVGQVPVIVKNSIDHWPAMNKWSLDYLIAVAGERTVPVEIGQRYTDTSWSQKLMTIKQFVTDYVLENDTKGYLAQHELFNQIPELRHDILIPDYCCLHCSDESESSEQEENIDINAWFGPQGTISPLHYDPKQNLLAQVIGCKYIRLYEEKYSELVYPYSSKMLSNTSQIDVENPDEETFPKFTQTPYFECILEPGDLLFIPARCWHYVRSLSISFSVSFWWD